MKQTMISKNIQKILILIFFIFLSVVFFYFKKPSNHLEIIEDLPLMDEEINTNVINIKLFWGKEGEDGVFEVLRLIPETKTIEEATIRELLKGPGINDKANGYYTAINENVTLLSLKIENGVAFADFDSELEKEVAGSAKVLLIRKQIEETLKQFPEINDVIISIERRVDDILQP